MIDDAAKFSLSLQDTDDTCESGKNLINLAWDVNLLSLTW